MTRRLVLISAALTVAACTKPSTAPGPARAIAVAPTADELRRDLFAFADDSMLGREAGTPNAFRGAKMIAARLAALGIEPGGDSGYFQRVPMTLNAVTSASNVTIVSASGRASVAVGLDIAPLTSLGAGAPPPHLVADAELVFGSYGITDAKLGRNDLAGLDLRGKAVVVVVSAPPGVTDSVQKHGFEGGPGIQSRLIRLIQSGPAAVVLVLAGGSAELYDQAAGQFMRGLTLIDTTPMIPEDKRVLPLVLLARDRPGSPLLPAGWTTNDKAQFAAGTRLSARIVATKSQTMEHNVVGVLRGSDPALNGTYVAFGGHLDHIGIQAGGGADSIANGADDDGSGSMAVLSIARAAAQGPRPKRSMLFVWHTAEEKGLLGSGWFTEHPTVPIDSIVAQLNADMIGRNGADSLYIVGPGAAPKQQSRVLGAIADSVNAALTRPFTIDRSFDSQNHPEQIYYRSDHFNYARKGIPILFFTTGLHADYHKVTDSPDKIDYTKMARIADFILRTGMAVANSSSRPR